MIKFEYRIEGTATEKEAMQFARWVNLAGKYEAITREKKS